MRVLNLRSLLRKARRYFDAEAKLVEGLSPVSWEKEKRKMVVGEVEFAGQVRCGCRVPRRRGEPVLASGDSA